MNTDTVKYFPDLNALFTRCHELGLACDHEARVSVSMATHPKFGITASVLLDYSTLDSDKSLAKSYAVGATFAFDGMSRLAYERICKQAKTRHNTGNQRDHSALAQAHALIELLKSSTAVCLFRDDQIMAHIAVANQGKARPMAGEGYAAVMAAPMYDGKSTLAGAMGSITLEMVTAKVNSTLAKQFVCVYEELLQERVAKGMHPSRRNHAA